MYFVSVRLREEWAAEIVTRPACKQQHVQTQGFNDVVTCAEQRLFFWWISCICIQHCLFFLLSTCVSLLTPSTSHQEALESLQEAMRELEAQPQTNMSYDEVHESYSQLMVRGVHNMYCKSCIYNAKTQVIKSFILSLNFDVCGWPFSLLSPTDGGIQQGFTLFMCISLWLWLPLLCFNLISPVYLRTLNRFVNRFILNHRFNFVRLTLLIRMQAGCKLGCELRTCFVFILYIMCAPLKCKCNCSSEGILSRRGLVRSSE